MYNVVHLTTSLVVGSQIDQPVWAFVLAFVTHCILDIIPHEPLSSKNKPHTIKRFFKLEIIDSFAIIVVLFILWKTNHLSPSISIITAIIGGWLPDILWGLNMLSKRKIKILDMYSIFHGKINNLISHHAPNKIAFLVQLLTFLIPLYIYLKII